MTTSNSSSNASLLSATASGNSLPRPVSPGVADTGRIRFGSGMRLPRPATSAGVADTGRIRFGSGMRLPRPATSAGVADSGRIPFGSGCRIPLPQSR